MSQTNLDVLRLLTTVCIQILVVLFSFKLRVKKGYALLLLLACLVCNIALDRLLEKIGNPVLLALQLDTLLFCIVIVFISAGNIYGQVFFHYTQNLIANCFYVISMQFAVYGKLTEFLVNEALMLAYLIVMLLVGKEVIAAVREFLAKPAWRLLILYPFASYYAIRLLGFESHRALYAPSTPLPLAISLLAGNMMAVICIVLVRKKLELDYELMEGRIALSASESYYQNLTSVLDQIRVIRHDYKHELGTIQQLVKNNEIKELKEFLKLPGIMDSEIASIYCTNTIVNAVLKHYASLCIKNNIPLEIKAVLPEVISAQNSTNMKKEPISNYDLCMIIGNLFENAIEASLLLAEQKRRILVSIDSDANRIIFNVKNYTEKNFHKNMQDLPVSTKAKDSSFAYHGLGLKSVKSICKIFGGSFFWSCHNNIFSASAIINVE